MYSSCEALTAPVIGSRSYCVPRYQAKPTADHMRVLEILEQVDGAADWRGVAVQERAGGRFSRSDNRPPVSKARGWGWGQHRGFGPEGWRKPHSAASPRRQGFVCV